MNRAFILVALMSPTVEGNGPCCGRFLAILLILWLLGMVTSYTLGGFIHVLLVIAIAVVIIRVIQGRRPLG